jgi:CrcB protein
MRWKNDAKNGANLTENPLGSRSRTAPVALNARFGKVVARKDEARQRPLASLWAAAMSASTLSPWIACVLVAAGGAVGSVARYLLGKAMLSVFPAQGFPWPLLTINTLGSLAMGLLFGWFYLNDGGTEGQRLLFAVGMLGGFTTFSAFSLEIILLVQRGSFSLALAFIAASVIAGVAGLYTGLIIMGPAK